MEPRAERTRRARPLTGAGEMFVSGAVEGAAMRGTMVFLFLCAALGGTACSTDPRPLGMVEPAEGPTGSRGGPDAAADDGGAPPGTEVREAEARRAFGQLPMRYEENRGQHDPRARYVARQGALTLFATDAGPVLALRVPEAPQGSEGAPSALGPARPALALERRAAEPREPAPARVWGLRLVLEGARESAPIEPSEPLLTRSNYFIGNDPSRWITDIPNYAALRYRQLAPGVDLVLRGSPEGRIEYDFVVAPGTDPELTVRFEGAERVRLGEGGTLEVHVGGVVLEQPAPVLYQEIDGRRVPIEGGYRIAGLDRVRFEVGDYDRTRPLVIDPVLVYSTYLGGSWVDSAMAVAVDRDGAAYVTGYTESIDFPTASPYRPASGGTDAFVAKLTPAGNALVYATYLGGSDGDGGVSIAVDGTGAAYVTGSTRSTDFPTLNAYQSAIAGDHDVFVAKLTPTGTSLAYSTYLGGSSIESPADIAVDGAGAAYVTGTTWSIDFPTESPTSPRPPDSSTASSPS